MYYKQWTIFISQNKKIIKMKRKLAKSIFVMTAVIAAGYGSYKAYATYETTDNTLLAENIEALTLPEGSSEEIYAVLDRDCAYTFQGKALSIIYIRIPGSTSIPLTVGADGTVRFTYGTYRTCPLGGNMKCTPTNCPNISQI
jgi:hypothetical protein